MPTGMMGQTGRPALLNFSRRISAGRGGPLEPPLKEVPNYGDPSQNNTATRRAANLRGPHLALACEKILARIRLRIEGVSDPQKP
jgi:hypothetical protein